ncbi:MAG: hypothetical protein GAK35_01621 [Herbaspirillum frisingense]|uniref:Uncharacterized protein n=1 Tax=Herbaspirillum frisingense TaxID=92645 RepID=A0A7V8FXN8_9BURK|nr:MAG: hypothetical protein GAK35_01621 [Herbaspirillum frisingense]
MRGEACEDTRHSALVHHAGCLYPFRSMSGIIRMSGIILQSDTNILRDVAPTVTCRLHRVPRSGRSLPEVMGQRRHWHGERDREQNGTRQHDHAGRSQAAGRAVSHATRGLFPGFASTLFEQTDHRPTPLPATDEHSGPQACTMLLPLKTLPPIPRLLRRRPAPIAIGAPYAPFVPPPIDKLRALHPRMETQEISAIERFRIKPSLRQIDAALGEIANLLRSLDAFRDRHQSKTSGHLDDDLAPD